jgi:hypothetical protein
VPPNGPMECEPDWALTSVWRRRQGGSRSVRCRALGPATNTTADISRKVTPSSPSRVRKRAARTSPAGNDDADVERVARIEWLYLPLFGHGERPAKLLHGELARNPEFFSTVVSWIFKADSEPPRDLTEEERVRGRLAYQLLDSWRQPPGIDSTGRLDSEALRTWVLAARGLVHQADRSDIGDQRIGQILRYPRRETMVAGPRSRFAISSRSSAVSTWRSA